jgi:hypothetical protein
LMKEGNSWECLRRDVEEAQRDCIHLLEWIHRAEREEPAIAVGLQRIREDKLRHNRTKRVRNKPGLSSARTRSWMTSGRSGRPGESKRPGPNGLESRSSDGRPSCRTTTASGRNTWPNKEMQKSARQHHKATTPAVAHRCCPPLLTDRATLSLSASER